MRGVGGMAVSAEQYQKYLNSIGSDKKVPTQNTSTGTTTTTATTNYGGQGNPLNEILYSKDQYDAGNTVWAKQNAQKYYSQLDPTEAATVKGLDAQGLRDYIAQKNTAGQTTGTSNAGATTTQQSSQSYIDALNEARKQQTLAQLGKSKDAALSNLGAEKAAIQPRYYDARNQTSAGSQQNARNFAEFMAARGGSSSGSNAQAELTRGMALQGNLGSLRRQETAAFDDVGRRTTDVENAYQSDVASANAGIEADRMQAMLTDYYNQQQRELQIAGLTGILNGQKTLAGQQFDWGKQVDTAGLTGIFNGTPTMALQNQNFNQNMATKQLERSQFESDRDYNFAVGQQEWSNNFQQSQFDWNKAQKSWENAFQEKNFEQSMKDAAASRGLQWASLNQRDKERVADEAFREKQFNYTVEQDKIANDLAAQKASASSPYDYKTDKEYAGQLSETMKDPAGAAEHMRLNAQAYINKFGIDGFNALRSAASSLIGG
jgi:hypothetical protein